MFTNTATGEIVTRHASRLTASCEVYNCTGTVAACSRTTSLSRSRLESHLNKTSIIDPLRPHRCSGPSVTVVVYSYSALAAGIIACQCSARLLKHSHTSTEYSTGPPLQYVYMGTFLSSWPTPVDKSDCHDSRNVLISSRCPSWTTTTHLTQGQLAGHQLGVTSSGLR